MEKRKRGRFIAFEGIDGSGKTTQIRLLQQRLQQKHIPCACTAEPTDGPVGRLIRQILRGDVRTDEQVIAPLFVADRTDHLLNPDRGIRRQLEEGTSILMDRYYFSSYAYQCSENVPMERIIDFNKDCAAILRPDATVFLDLKPEEAMRRISANREHTEIFETMERLTRVRGNYFTAFERMREEETVITVDAQGDEEELSERIWRQLSGIFVS